MATQGPRWTGPTNYARALAPLGIDVALLEYPGYGARPGQPSLDTLVNAALEAVDVLAREGRVVWLLECLAGARACPPEDCGGAHGYADLLKALFDPSNDRHAAMKEWVGSYFAPEEFDLPSVDRELRGAGSAAWRRKRERVYGSRN